MLKHVSWLEKENYRRKTMSRVLVVGGAGFLGGHVINTIRKDGWKTRAMDVAPPEAAWRINDAIAAKDCEYVWKSAADILESDFDDVSNVCFLGAIADVPLAIKSPTYTFQQNIFGILKYMETVSRLKEPPRTIYMSSESVYGRIPIEQQPIKEDVMLNPTNAYAASKASAEIICRSFAEQFNLPVVILRSTTMYGPASRSKQVVPIFIRQALRGQDITVEGDGSQSRDFNYVMNMVNAIQLILKSYVHSGTFNIGSGVELTIKELAEQIIRISGSSSKVVNGPWRPGEQGIKLNVSIEKAESQIGYKPMYTVELGLSETISWIREHL
jgi:nucleoside-diphosphate-sugar epimerase